jgi:hypothetical protein
MTHAGIAAASLGSLAILSSDVLQECILGNFLDDYSILSLSCCNHHYARMLLGKSSFAMKLWKSFCTKKWKYVQFQQEDIGDDVFSNNESGTCVNRWVREYRNRSARDHKAYEMMSELSSNRISNLHGTASVTYAMLIRNGMDCMDMFLKKRRKLQWLDERMAEAIQNGLIRFELCKRFQKVLHDIPDDCDFSSELLENSLIWISKYLKPALEFVLPSNSVVEHELNHLAQLLLQRLQQNQKYRNGERNDRIVLEEMMYLFDDTPSSMVRFVEQILLIVL